MIFKVIITIGLLGIIGTNAQVCTTGYCGSNGKCVIKNNTAVCECNYGFVGSKCQLNDPCTNRPCGFNGACYPVVQLIQGTIVEQVSSYCQCYSGFSGSTCQNAAPRPCSSNPCLNGGRCVEIQNTWDYVCECVEPYSGSNCGIYNDYCANNKCENEALCVPNYSSRNYTCRCISGFYGTFCETEIDECKVEINGQITSPCKNNGTCFDLIDGFYCSCSGSWIGVNCETYVNPCQSNPCGVGATCVANGNSYTCTCQTGYFGNPCQPNPCNSNPCRQPGSKCVPIEGGTSALIPGCTCTTGATYVCVCPGTFPEYASQLC